MYNDGTCKNDRNPPKIKSNKFNHVFSGWSVWLEPSPDAPETKSIVGEMKTIANKCGGEENGVSKFLPHCTLLYNFDPKRLHVPGLQDDEDSGLLAEFDEMLEHEREIEIGKKLLEKCKISLQKKLSCLNSTFPSSQPESSSSAMHPEIGDLPLIKPTSLYFFPYPKEADDGTGFGCVIPLLILENTRELGYLQSIVSEVFPPDERHGENSTNGGEFIPHMALCYAPEANETDLERYVEDLKKNRLDLLRGMQADCISIWSTQGQVKDWKLIHRTKLT